MSALVRYAACALIASICLFAGPSAAAQRSAKVKRLEQQRKAMQEEIRRTNELLKKKTSSAAESLKQLKIILRQIDVRKDVIGLLTAEIAASDSSILVLQQDIDSLQVEFDKHKETYIASIRAMQHRNYSHEQLMFILSAKDFAEGMRRAQYLKEYAQWQKGEATKVKTIQGELQERQAAIRAERAQKNTLLEEREEERQKLVEQEVASRQQVNALQAEKKELQRALSKQQKQARALDQQIEAQIAREIAAAQEEARREAEARERERKNASGGNKDTSRSPVRKAESKGGYAMTTEEVKLSGRFEENKGRLPAPITGRYTVVGTFGEHQHRQLKQVRVNSSGIDLQGLASAQARAVFDGVVTRIFVVEGYNNSIIVRHGKYLTVYSNLSSVQVTTGQQVKAGDILGKIYSDPELGGACTLHFQLWKERTKLNPAPWIR